MIGVVKSGIIIENLKSCRVCSSPHIALKIYTITAERNETKTDEYITSKTGGHVDILAINLSKNLLVVLHFINSLSL